MSSPNLHLDKRGKKCRRGESAFREGEPSKESLKLKLSKMAKEELQSISNQLGISRSEVIEQLLRHHHNALIGLLQKQIDQE